MKNKISVLVLSVMTLSAGCSIFSSPVVAGVVKTVNGGGDWQFSNSIKDNDKASISGSTISVMKFDPQNREVIYAGSYNSGLYKSEDSGTTWKQILSKIFVYDFVIHPTNSKLIFAAGYFADQGRLLKTLDGGATWEEVYNEANSDTVVRTVTLDPNNPNQLLIGTADGNLIKSSDSGSTWKLVANFQDRINRVLWQNSGVYVLLTNKGLFKGTESAGNFQDLTAGLNKNNSFGVSSVMTFNQAYIDSLTPGLMYVTTSQGLYKTVDEAKTWQKVPLPVKQAAEEARAIAVSKNSSNIIFTSIGEVIYKSTDGGSTWQTQYIATTGFINYILIDPQLPQIAYAGLYATSD